MTTRNDFTEAAQTEIIDSLDDARENHENVMESDVPADVKELAALVSYTFGRTLYTFRDGKELGNADLSLIREALELSIENCIELELDEAEASYRAALAEVREVR